MHYVFNDPFKKSGVAPAGATPYLGITLKPRTLNLEKVKILELSLNMKRFRCHFGRKCLILRPTNYTVSYYHLIFQGGQKSRICVQPSDVAPTSALLTSFAESQDLSYVCKWFVILRAEPLDNLPTSFVRKLYLASTVLSRCSCTTFMMICGNRKLQLLSKIRRLARNKHLHVG